MGGRTDAWRNLTADQCIPLVAQSLDAIEQKQETQQRILIGVLVFTATASLGLAINVIVETVSPDRASPVAAFILFVAERLAG